MSIGSNLGDRLANCTNAIELMKQDDRVSLQGVASFYLTAPVGDIVQDDFINTALAFLWEGTPEELLSFLLETEITIGRVRDIPKGPRTIDLDILLFGDMIVDSPKLVIPHPALLERRFALVPCVEIDPSLTDPVSRRMLVTFPAYRDESQQVTLFHTIPVEHGENRLP